MTAAQQNRQPKGIPTGGRFAPDTHAEPEVQLGADDYRPTVIQVGSLKVSNYSYRNEPMPAWPESLPQPEPYIVFDDGRPQVVLAVEGLPEVTFWRSDMDESCSSFDNGDEEWPDVDDEVTEEVQEYGNELCNRVQDHVYGITMEACQAPGVQKAIMDDALLRAPEAEQTHREKALDRAERAIAAAGASEDDPESDLADMLANLRHYADKHGLDFGAVDGRAYRYYADEIADPDFDTSY